MLSYHNKNSQHHCAIPFKKGYEIYYADVTLPLLKRVGYKIVKVVIPGLQPFYMNEILPYLGGERLTEVPKNYLINFHAL